MPLVTLQTPLVENTALLAKVSPFPLMYVGSAFTAYVVFFLLHTVPAAFTRIIILCNLKDNAISQDC